MADIVTKNEMTRHQKITFEDNKFRNQCRMKAAEFNITGACTQQKTISTAMQIFLFSAVDRRLRSLAFSEEFGPGRD
jgi:hypothetical protein